jgi:23S rRNA pseudouridine1911/1915/1917 synthase
MNVLYEDNHLIAVNKLPGLLTQPTDQETDSQEIRLKAWIKKKYAKPGAVYLHAIHRLDKDVGGIVLFAKTSKALTRMNEAMRSRAVKKIYLAASSHDPKKDEEDLHDYLLHESFRARVVPKEHPKGKKSHLRYRVLQRTAKMKVFQVELFTGRYHQIRVQCAEAGFPLIGDSKYNPECSHKQTIHLCHWKMSFPHPVTKKRIEITSPFPQWYPSSLEPS